MGGEEERGRREKGGGRREEYSCPVLRNKYDGNGIFLFLVKPGNFFFEKVYLY